MSVAKSRAEALAVADELEQLKSDRASAKWFDALPDTSRDALLLIRKRFRAGKYSQVKLIDIWRHCRKRLAIPARKTAFLDWLKEVDD